MEGRKERKSGEKGKKGERKEGQMEGGKKAVEGGT